ncbi:MAG: FIG00418427: hypothetical protein [uncultured Microvirga sp.]|uniref:TIGR02300 family protein n=1 Tax=uncultured Microvirga sp. TaxID=412392 RepID=A0A6J4LWJ1_9HYPH|nr:MAG: FIG00418427: hypothetical protein [uncultured Microvirga sp.]
MAKPDLGTKRICPTTGKKFFDMNRDPVVSPYTGQSFPRSTFDPPTKASAGPRARAAPVEEEAEIEPAGPEIVSLEEVEAGEAEKEVVADDEVEVADDVAASDDTFLEEEEEGDDVAGLIDGDIEDEEEV